MSRRSTTKVERGEVPLYTLACGGKRGLPWVRHSRGDGPVLAVTSAVHGDETSGVRAQQLLWRKLQTLTFTGTIFSLPVVNPGAFEAGTRRVAETDEDLNRNFPGRPDGSYTERVAYAAFQTLLAEKPDCHVDLHCDATASIPYVILDRYLDARVERMKRRVEELSASFGVLRMYDWPLELYRSAKLDASLSGSVLNRGRLPSFTVELGPCRAADERMASLACRGLLALMARLGMLPGKPLAPAGPVALRRFTAVRAERSGLVRFRVRPGQRVQAQTPLCDLSGLLDGAPTVFRSPSPGLVVSMPDRCWCTPGQPLVTLAVADG
jgi:hypothetical protein